MEHTFDENLIASFIDKKLTPLEQLAFSEAMQNCSIEEIVEISKDVKFLESKISNIEPMRIPECERYLEKIYNQELISEIDSKPKNHIF